MSSVDQLVVTHFDLDHWQGLQDLASTWHSHRARPAKTVEIAYPGLPSSVERLPAGYLALISTASGSTGVRALDLIRTWESVADVERKPLRQGDLLVMGCDEWEVLWPPASLPEVLLESIAGALDELWSLAQDLAVDGHSQLLNNLREAYEEYVGFPSEQSASESSDSLRSDGDNEDSDTDLDHDTSDPWAGGDEATPAHDVDFVDQDAFPEHVLPRARQLARRLGGLNNRLSLVVHNPAARYQPMTLILGDLEGSPLRQLTASSLLQERYDLILAPHHGTHAVPAGFPTARVCVAQAGRRHQKRWRGHLDSHDDSGCLSTAVSGDIAVY